MKERVTLASFVIVLIISFVENLPQGTLQLYVSSTVNKVDLLFAITIASSLFSICLTIFGTVVRDLALRELEKPQITAKPLGQLIFFITVFPWACLQGWSRGEGG